VFKNQSVLAIIPARGGSSRVVGKNKRIVGGLPLISWTIRACFGCSHIDQVVLSTDDCVIEDIARSEGVKRIHTRPSHLASDISPTIDTVVAIISELEQEGARFDWILLAQPTSPLRSADHLYSAFGLLDRHFPASIVSVTSSDHPREWSGHLAEDGDMTEFIKEARLDLSSTQLPPTYVINGAIYLAPSVSLVKENTFFSKRRLFAYFMQPEDSIDIDTEFDLQIANFLLSEKLP